MNGDLDGFFLNCPSLEKLLNSFNGIYINFNKLNLGLGSSFNTISYSFWNVTGTGTINLGNLFKNKPNTSLTNISGSFVLSNTGNNVIFDLNSETFSEVKGLRNLGRAGVPPELQDSNTSFRGNKLIKRVIFKPEDDLPNK